jgi:hypothetical protein
MRKASIILMSLALMLSLVSCKTGERTGRALDRAAEKTGHALKKAGQATGRAVEKAGESIKDASED